MDYFKYFDKNPLVSYCLGPEDTGILYSQPFNTEWSGYFDADKGLYFKSITGDNLSFIEQINYPSANSFSFCFDSGNNLSYCIGETGVLNLHIYSGESVQNYSFSADYGQIYNNSVLKRDENKTLCFYVKNHDIYYRSSEDDFSIERLSYSGNKSIKRLNQIIKSESPLYYRLDFFAIDEVADGIRLITSKHEPISTGFYQDFQALNIGNVTSFPDFDIEEPTTSFIYALNFLSDNFGAYTTGDLNLLSGFSNINSGYFIDRLYFFAEDFQSYPTGSVTILTGMNNIKSGYFING